MELLVCDIDSEEYKSTQLIFILGCKKMIMNLKDKGISL